MFWTGLSLLLVLHNAIQPKVNIDSDNISCLSGDTAFCIFLSCDFLELGTPMPRPHNVSIRLCSTGFSATKSSLVKWSKHGCTCLAIPGHDPPMDITVFMDISQNPGPSNCQSDTDAAFTTCIQSKRPTCYTRYELLQLRRPTFRASIDQETFYALKLNGIFRYRGRRGGRRKISVVINHRCDYVARPRPSPYTRVLTPFRSTVMTVQEQNSAQLKLCCLNTRSVKSKSAAFADYVSSSKADLYCLTETWLTEMDTAYKAEITPTGFTFLDHPRNNHTGGGTGLLFRDSLHTTRVAAGELISFEYSEWIVSYKLFKLRILIIYRPPYSTNHPVSTATFFSEFGDYLESVVLSTERLLITGDFNVHVDVPEDRDSIRLLELLESMGLQQHVNQPTHEHGHTLDLIITRRNDEVVTDHPSIDHLFSDHFAVLCNLNIAKPSLPTKHVSYRKIKSIDIEALELDLASSKLCRETPNDLNVLVDCYNSTLVELLDRHAPTQTKTIKARPLLPWFNDEIKAAKRLQRQAERKWRHSGNVSDLMSYKYRRNRTNYLMKIARKDFYSNLIMNNSSDPGKLFAITKNLLGHRSEVPLPPFTSKHVLANEMGQFFVQKINRIQNKLDSAVVSLIADPPISDASPPMQGILLERFSPLLDMDTKALIARASKKSCSLDPMPTTLVVNCLDVILPVLTEMINLSLDSGVFALNWKDALVTPLLKKANLDLSFNNYRPISNLQFVSKLVEMAVFQQVHSHMTTHSLYPTFQSSYRKHHSTETALLKVKNDILLNMNSQQVTLLVLLDLSAAFDTVNHNILLQRLQTRIGIRGKALDWFSSYLADRRQRISIQGVLSDAFDINCGVPQGSCLGPLLFNIYASKLFDIVDKHLPNVHCYADDTQLYLSFKPGSNVSQVAAVEAMENCISDIRAWMLHDKLMINDDKTEFLIIGTKQQLAKLSVDSLKIGSTSIVPSTSVRNLGAWFDSNLGMSTHITKACSISFFHLHNIRRISKFLSKNSLITLIHAFITNRLDYCNSLLYGLPTSELAKLQRVHNVAARLVSNTHKFDHISPVLRQLHWLPVKFRVDFKILLLTFKALHGLAPKYICDLVTVKTASTYCLRSNNKVYLENPKCKILKTLGGRSFQYAAPELWNKLPIDIQQSQSTAVFKRKVKTYLFKLAFN